MIIGKLYNYVLIIAGHTLGFEILVCRPLPAKIIYLENLMLEKNELRHENGCVKSSSQLQGEHCKC